MRNTFRFFIFSLSLMLSHTAQASKVRIGLGLGAPSGLAVLVPLSESYALQSTIGLTTFKSGYYLDADFVRTFPNAIGAFTGVLGLGVILTSLGRVNGIFDANPGIRIPLGVYYTVDTMPVDFFITLAPTAFLGGGSFDIDFMGNLGVRILI